MYLLSLQHISHLADDIAAVRRQRLRQAHPLQPMKELSVHRSGSRAPYDAPAPGVEPVEPGRPAPDQVALEVLDGVVLVAVVAQVEVVGVVAGVEGRGHVAGVDEGLVSVLVSAVVLVVGLVRLVRLRLVVMVLRVVDLAVAVQARGSLGLEKNHSRNLLYKMMLSSYHSVDFHCGL